MKKSFKENKKLIILTAIIVLFIIVVCIGVLLFGKKNKENTNNNTSTLTNKNGKNELIYNNEKNFDYEEVDNGIAITGFKNYDYIEYDKIIIPTIIDGKTVVGIGLKDNNYIVMSAIFGNCEVVIPKTVTYIARNAFQNAKGLVKLSGGENVTEIYENAFSLCENLKEITFINNVKYIDASAFSACSNFNYTFESKLVNPNQILSLDSMVLKYSNNTNNESFTIDFNQKASTFKDEYHNLHMEVDKEKNIITRLEFDMKYANSFYINNIQLSELSLNKLKEKLGEPYAELISSEYDSYFKCNYYERRYVYKTNQGYILFDTNLTETKSIEIIRNEYINLDKTLNDFIKK